jgi:non-heme chloroperoxidase
VPRIAVGAEDDAPIGVHDEDHGTGAIHGYPLNGNSWERQERELRGHGYRVISYELDGPSATINPTRA